MRFVPATLLVALAVWWVAIDARRRVAVWYPWAALVAVTGPVGLAAWLIFRSRRPETFQHTPRTVLVTVTAVLPLMALSVVLGTVLSSYVGQMVTVRGMAMSPTLEDGDRGLADRRAYRNAAPGRHDIVMLRYPRDPSRSFVKRIVGLSGETIMLRDGVVFVDGRPLEEPFIAADARSHDSWGPERVPDGHYFVLGDRRNNSADSRSWGYVPREYVLGRVWYRWWPAARRGRLP